MIGSFKSLPSPDAGTTPAEAMQRMGQGAMLIDVREAGEQRNGIAQGAHAMPLCRLCAGGIGAFALRPRVDSTICC